MVDFSIQPSKKINFQSKEIAVFINDANNENIDWKTVQSFGDEYFDIVPKSLFNNNSIVLDVGCGSGRWSKYLADKVGQIEAIDPSKAVFVASQLLAKNNNVRISQASVDNIPFRNESFDLVFSLGVLHHIPDTKEALKKCVDKVKKGGYFLVYLYYKIDHLPFYMRVLFFCSNILRRIINKLPKLLKRLVCDCIALTIYLPFSFLSAAIEKIFHKKKWYKHIPLWYYRTKPFKIMRNDALDRFGTPLEQRFSKEEIYKMMSDAGLKNIHFSENAPYWHAIGRKY